MIQSKEQRYYEKKKLEILEKKKQKYLNTSNPSRRNLTVNTPGYDYINQNFGVLGYQKYTIDIEGFRANNKYIPYLMGVYNGNKEHYVDVLEGEECIQRFFKKYITTNTNKSVFYAHHGGIFDFNLILDEIEHSKIERIINCRIKPICQGSKIIYIRLNSKEVKTNVWKDYRGDYHTYDTPRYHWVFKDSGALLNFSLKELCETFGVEHPKIDIEKYFKGDKNE